MEILAVRMEHRECRSSAAQRHVASTPDPGISRGVVTCGLVTSYSVSVVHKLNEGANWQILLNLRPLAGYS